MAGEVKGLLLPQPVGQVPQWVGYLFRSLIEFGESVRVRLNGSLAKDGSEAAVYYPMSASIPDDPPDGQSVMYSDPSTGDLMVKITFSGVTKTGAIVDYSALP